MPSCNFRDIVTQPELRLSVTAAVGIPDDTLGDAGMEDPGNLGPSSGPDGQPFRLRLAAGSLWP